jgi:hypothetical protein
MFGPLSFHITLSKKVNHYRSSFVIVDMEIEPRQKWQTCTILTRNNVYFPLLFRFSKRSEASDISEASGKCKQSSSSSESTLIGWNTTSKEKYQLTSGDGTKANAFERTESHNWWKIHALVAGFIIKNEDLSASHISHLVLSTNAEQQVRFNVSLHSSLRPTLSSTKLWTQNLLKKYRS